MNQKPAYPVIPSERGEDLHNLDYHDTADLVLFMAGNQFMVMETLIAAFQRRHPEIPKIYYETLPPRLELNQILAGGALFRERLIDVVPDVYASVSREAMVQLEEAALLAPEAYHLYLHNRIVLMVPRGNPAGIRSVADLGRGAVRISQPNPEYEDIAHHILRMYRQAGGDSLRRRIMEEKAADGTTLLTVLHHRETPERIIAHEVDAGPVWATEIEHARKKGLPVDLVEPGEALDQRDRIDYYICRLKGAPHPDNAGKFLDFILSDEAQGIYRQYGFVPYRRHGASPDICLSDRHERPQRSWRRHRRPRI
jgi:ABC-type molybdate transport system substrate-binding protein